MQLRVTVVALVCASCLSGQKQRFSWQDYCFKNSTSVVCPGHESAVRKQPPAQQPSAQPSGVTYNPFATSPRTGTPALVDLGAIDWRFADPFADMLIGFNVGRLVSAPLTRGLIARLAARQGLSEDESRRIFDSLADVDQLALSVRGNQIVCMITGHVADAAPPPPEAGLKSVQLTGGVMLLGHAGAVDQAISRIGWKSPLDDRARLATQYQAASELWTFAPAALAGPDAVAAGVRRVSVAISVRDRLTSEVAFEFGGTPNPETLRRMSTRLAGATLAGNTLIARSALEPGEANRKLDELVAGPLGPQFGALIQAARSLPSRAVPAGKLEKPVIYGLEDGPKVVTH